MCREGSRYFEGLAALTDHPFLEIHAELFRPDSKTYPPSQRYDDSRVIELSFFSASGQRHRPEIEMIATDQAWLISRSLMVQCSSPASTKVELVKISMEHDAFCGSDDQI